MERTDGACISLKRVRINASARHTYVANVGMRLCSYKKTDVI
jgi:hypothetical protein